ncbi:unnamed protein product [Rotaria sp. Silwood2]|nr:unnamed protein product [Rotaria sp. Silwood2]CAF2871255.1 unnamed protein product [Rotaria sp. Silwood2]CAF3261784.1 unnamed protein product [Rotaria sp. Silwood2]CAF3292194.1 unnamed protein product [Rotaria sp. Silwood2]CAF4171763.1 unnamed protein product [Rotaria sp. Silwood2]
MDSRVILSDKNTMPRLGLGTWRSEPEKVQNIVKEAILNCGYRHIDCAWLYKNESEVGNGINEALDLSQGKIKREDLFITTKLWNQHHGREDVEWAIRDSLEKLRLDYVDLYLMHWPVAFKKMNENQWSQNEDKTVRYYDENITLADTWKSMERLVDLKLVRSIGVSNFKPSEINEIIQIARIKPVVNQIELHPYLNQKELREYSKKENLILTSYCPLANLKRLNEREEETSPLYNPIIKQIAKSKNRTTSQIIIRWHLQHGLTLIPKTITLQRLYENCQVFDFNLSDNDMFIIDQLEKTHHRRFVNPPFLPPGNKNVFDD